MPRGIRNKEAASPVKVTKAGKRGESVIVAVFVDAPLDAMPDFGKIPGIIAAVPVDEEHVGKRGGVGYTPRGPVKAFVRGVNSHINVSVYAVDSTAKGKREAFDAVREAFAAKSAKPEPASASTMPKIDLSGWGV